MFDINSVIDRTLIYFPVFKLLLNNLHFVEDNSVQTACTNGDTVFYNPTFFQSLSKDEQVFIVAHELMHITLKHLSRLEGRDIEIWNYATDAVINQILVQNGLSLVPGLVDCPDALSFSAEEYYEIVKNRPDCKGLMEQYRRDRQKGTISTHERWNEELSDRLSESLSDILPCINEHNITEVNRKMIHDENQTFLDDIPSSEAKSDTLGSVVTSEPIIDWKRFLQSRKKKIISADYNLFNGEFDEEGIYKYPFEVIRRSSIEILIDTSGSVDDDLVKAFLQECKNIFDGFTLKVGCFDTEFYGFHEIKQKEDLDNFLIEGRGGTNFSVVVNSFSRKTPIKIIFTDGYSDVPNVSCDAIWVVYGDQKINPPGGSVFYVDPKTLSLKGKSI